MIILNLVAGGVVPGNEGNNYGTPLQRGRKQGKSEGAYQLANTLSPIFSGGRFPGKFKILGALRCILRVSETLKQCSYSAKV